MICLKGGNAWTAQYSDFGQQLIIDLGTVYNITSIDIQGRPHSTEYVTEFTISYGYNGLDYADYKEPGGNTKVNRTEADHFDYFACWNNWATTVSFEHNF